MSRPRYRLQSLIELRDRARKEAGERVAFRRSQLATAEELLARCHHALFECRDVYRIAQDQMIAASRAGIGAHRLLNHRSYLAGIKLEEQRLIIDLDRQREAVLQASAELDKAIDAFIEASNESRMIEQHRSAWRERMGREQKRLEQKQHDEIGALIHERSRSGGRIA